MQYTGQTIGIFGVSRLAMEEWWILPRTLRGGTQAMRAAAETYLPAYNVEMRNRDLYKKRLNKARLFPAYDRAVCDLASLPFQKAPALPGIEELDPRLQKLQENADRCGTSLWAFMAQIHEDAIDRGIGLFLVDNVPTGGVSIADAEKMDVRPYFARVMPDNLVGSVSVMKNGAEKVVDLRVREWVTTTNGDGTETTVQRIRHWDETNVEVWQQRSGSAVATAVGMTERGGNTGPSGFDLVEPPRPHGFPDGVPVVVHYTRRLSSMLAQPPMEELAWENVAHWQARSEQDAALTMGRFPILRGKGLSEEVAERQPVLGPGATVTDTSSDADWAFVEISGASIAAGDKQLDRIESNMAWLAMQPIVQANGPTTATGEVRADVREKATAQKWAEGLEWAFYRAFGMAAAWIDQSLPDAFDVALWRDFSILSPSAQQDIANMQADLRDGHLTLGTYLRELKRRGKLAEDWDPEEEEVALDADAEKKQEADMQRVIAQIERERQTAGAPAQPDSATPGAERAARQGNIDGANKLWQQAADMIGIANLGKAPKAKAGAL